jgi:endonuclease/exonuclease/phosphatase family metal-dependent hydrolase
VLVGDFNSEPTDPAPSPYGVLAAAGFTDAWLERVGRPVAGSTCCHVETLDNPVPDLDERIDHVWVRNDPRPSALAPVRAVRFELFGDEPGEMTATGLWPSDHAGLSAHLVLPATR